MKKLFLWFFLVVALAILMLPVTGMAQDEAKLPVASAVRLAQKYRIPSLVTDKEAAELHVAGQVPADNAPAVAEEQSDRDDAPVPANAQPVDDDAMVVAKERLVEEAAPVVAETVSTAPTMKWSSPKVQTDRLIRQYLLPSLVTKKEVATLRAAGQVSMDATALAEANQEEASLVAEEPETQAKDAQTLLAEEPEAQPGDMETALAEDVQLPGQEHADAMLLANAPTEIPLERLEEMLSLSAAELTRLIQRYLIPSLITEKWTVQLYAAGRTAEVAQALAEAEEPVQLPMPESLLAEETSQPEPTLEPEQPALPLQLIEADPNRLIKRYTIPSLVNKKETARLYAAEELLARAEIAEIPAELPVEEPALAEEPVGEETRPQTAFQKTDDDIVPQTTPADNNTVQRMAKDALASADSSRLIQRYQVSTLVTSRKKQVLFPANLSEMYYSGAYDIRICQEEIEEAIRNNDPTPLIQKYLIPYLEEDPKAALLFASELNISNGAPDTRNFGERGMFDKLVDSAYVMDHYKELEPRAADIFGEVKRLLVGPWNNGGSTSYGFAVRNNESELCYLTGRWEKRTDELPVILVEHYTEYSHKRRIAFISCDYENLQDDGYYHAAFHLVRPL